MVADFGLASIQNHLSSLATRHHNTSQQPGGTLRWMALERLDGEPPSNCSDLYSFAITAWELYSSEIPFLTVPDSALPYLVVTREKRPPRPISLKNEDLWTLICTCWHADPQKRPVFSDVHEKLKVLSNLGDTLQ